MKDIEKLLGRANLLHTVHKLRRIGAVETRYTPPQLKKIYKTIDFSGCCQHRSGANRRKICRRNHSPQQGPT
ncbi:MAG: hypothetical protein R3C26_18455 [Calditrichia bacterium]